VPQRRALALLMALMAIGAYALTITPIETGDIGAMIDEVSSRLMYGVVIPIVVAIILAAILAKILEWYLSKRRSRRSGQMRCTCYCE